MNEPPSTPMREATSLLAVGAFLVGIGAYASQLHGVPFISEVMSGLSSLLYSWIPSLSGLTIPRASELISSLAAALMLYAFGIPFTPAIARMCGPRIGEMESHMRSMQRKPRRAKFR